MNNLLEFMDGEEPPQVKSKKCRECEEVLPFTAFGYRNATQNKPELLNTCKKCKATHDRVVRRFKKYNPKPDSEYRCPVCKETGQEIKSRGGFHEHQPKDVWAVDVCHETMTVRGYICDYCNNMIGRSLDREYVMIRGSKWLTEYETMKSEVNPNRSEL